MSDFGNRDSHLEALETLSKTVGPGDEQKHQGGYFSQNEYATRIYYWAGEEHEPDEIEAVIATLANCGWARTPARELAMAGTVLAFCELYQDKEPGWRSAYPKLFEVVRRALKRDVSSTQWNDFYIAQWFVLRRARKEDGIEIIDKLLDRIADGGQVGYDTRREINTCAVQCKPFEIALGRAIAARRQRMVIQ
jgi:hypothetical protein